MSVTAHVLCSVGLWSVICLCHYWLFPRDVVLVTTSWSTLETYGRLGFGPVSLGSRLGRKVLCTYLLFSQRTNLWNELATVLLLQFGTCFQLLIFTRRLLTFLSLDSKHSYLVTFIISVAGCGQCLWFIQTTWHYTNLVLLSLLLLLCYNGQYIVVVCDQNMDPTDDLCWILPVLFMWVGEQTSSIQHCILDKVRLRPIKAMTQCFSTTVPRNLRVPPVASKSSAESNRETETRRHLRTLDMISRLLVRPKCICGRDSAPCSPQPP